MTIVQLKVCPPWVSKWVMDLRHDFGHPYMQALEKFGLAQVHFEILFTMLSNTLTNLIFGIAAYHQQPVSPISFQPEAIDPCGPGHDFSARS